MTTERKELLAKVNELINKRRKQLLDRLPSVHEVDDGIIIRFFAEWDDCNENNDIKYKRIISDNPNEVVIFYYLPKGAYFELKERAYINCIVCLNGSIEIVVNNDIKVLNSNHKICLNNNLFEGRALENTYLLTTNNRPN
jgi:hypothetical protein